MKVLGVIPARMASQRFPGKPLQNIAGMSLVQRVWEQARQCKTLTKLVIATEDAAIAEHAREIGAASVMTSSSNRTGSDRVAEVARSTQGEEFDLIANIQGDMPFINPAVIDTVIRALQDAPSHFGIATPVTPITDRAEYERPAAVKCVFQRDMRALYFSRSPMPYWRAAHPDDGHTPWAHKHLGLYVFRPAALQELTALPASSLELSEGLEQLRALEGGIPIRAVPIDRAQLEPSIEVDTPEDLARAIEWCNR